MAILLDEMRRLVLVIASLAALAAPAAVLAAKSASGDGSLVVRNGSAPKGPVVMLRITGSVIGEVKGNGRLVVDPGVNADPPEVSGATLDRKSKLASETAQAWTSNDGFKFRAVDGTFTILIYGEGVNVVALGKGWARVAGTPGIAVGDGRYSLNGADFRSLPGDLSDKLFLPANG